MSAELERKAEANILESIEKLVTTSCLMLLFECLSNKNHPSLKLALKEKSVKGIYDYVFNITSDLQRIAEGGSSEKEFHLRKTIQMKEMLLEVYGVIKLYISACNIIDSCIEEQSAEFGDVCLSEAELAAQKSLLRSKAEQLLEGASKHGIEEAASSILFAILPNCFSDKETANYAAFSGKFYYENSPECIAKSHIKQIMQSFAPHKMPDYGKYYKREADKLYKTFEDIRTGGLDNELNKIISRYNKIYDNIDGLADVIASLYSELTYITIILSSVFSFAEIMKEKSYYGYYTKSLDFFKEGEHDSEALDKLLGSMEDTIEYEIQQLNGLAKRKEVIYKNMDFEMFSEDTKSLFSMEFFMAAIFFEGIDDAYDSDGVLASPENKRFADFKTAQKEVKALSLFIKENCLAMNEVLKKGARRNLFVSVPMASSYGRGKMMSYIDMMLKKGVKPVEMEAVIEAIDAILKEDVIQKLSTFEI